MVSFKANTGSMLFEIMVATAIMGMLFSAIFALQSTVTRSVMHVTQRFDRVLAARNFLIESSAKAETTQQDEVTSQKKITNPKTELIYKKSNIASDEPFGKYVKNMVKEQVTIRWKDGLQERQDAYIVYTYKPKKNAQEKAVSSAGGTSA